VDTAGQMTKEIDIAKGIKYNNIFGQRQDYKRKWI
jgi:hypothetical protein